MLRRFSINFALLSIFIDMMIVDLCLWLAVIIRPALNEWYLIEYISTPINLPKVLYGISPIVFVIIFLAFAIYDGRKYLRIVDEFTALSMAFIVASVSFSGILFFSYREVSRALVLLFLLLTYASLLLWRSLARLYFHIQKEWPDTNRRVIIVGTGPLGQKVGAQLLASRMENLQLIGFIDDNGHGKDNKPKVIGFSKKICQVIADSNITDVIIALPHSVYHRMAEIVAKLEEAPVRVWVALGFFDLALYQTAIEDFAGIPMIDLRAPALNEIQRLFKRGFDLILGLLVIIITLPLMVISALAIWLEDGSPVFFRQQRAGENGKLFTVYKFRTMVKKAEQLRHLVESTDENGNIIHKSKHDPRVTRVGRFLRRTSLDELPQLFNVLQGTMSLVGPRPELPYLVERYQPWQRKRFAVPPGITGWWQVSGRSERVMHLHTEDDLYYISNYSIWLDIMILFRTIWVILIGRGSY